MISILGWLIAALISSVSFIAWLYAITNDSGHTGLEPRMLSIILFPAIVIISFFQLFGKFRGASYRCALVVAISGTLAGIVLPALGVIEQYDAWATKGLQPPNRLSLFYLLGWPTFTLIAIWFFSIKPANTKA